MLDRSAVRTAASAVAEVLWATALYARPRWGLLAGHGRATELWWRSEMALALESWCWSSQAYDELGVLCEAKPRDAGLGETREAVDLAVVGWRSGRIDFDAEVPRIWIELKERSTWWPNATKAFGTANGGLRHDVQKWQDAGWTERDQLLVCQVLFHDGSESEMIPADYHQELCASLEGCEQLFMRHVGFPLPDKDGQPRVRWLTMCVSAV